MIVATLVFLRFHAGLAGHNAVPQVNKRLGIDDPGGNAMSDILDRIAVTGNAIVLLIGRVLLAGMFLRSGFGKLTNLDGTTTYMANHHLPAPFVFAVLAGLVEFFGSALVLLGFKTRYAALLMALFTLVAAFIGHPFWSVAPPDYANQLSHFLKDITIIGGFLVLFVAGPGALSIDRPK
jgi:putative oxidoreductase